MCQYAVSVIVPIYKVQPFIKRCAESLFEQTLENVEYIFVNDATPDKSIDILEECIAAYPEKKNYIHILHHEKNKGLPTARNSGLRIASGTYIFHCDSDDYLEKNALEALYGMAKSSDADIVWSDWFLTFRENERYMKEPGYDTSDGMLKGMLAGAMKYNVWNKLVKRRLYIDNGIVFPDGHPMGEDMTMIRLAACAEKVSYVNQALYHYVRLNPNAYTSTLSEKQLADIRYNVDNTIGFLQNICNPDIRDSFHYFKLSVKFPFLIEGDAKNFSLWQEWYPDSNPYIIKNKSISFRSRILQYMAWKGQYWYIKLYYYAVTRLIYGFIFK